MERSRRAFLSAVGTSAFLAGCSGVFGSGGSPSPAESESDTPAVTPTATPTATAVPTSTPAGTAREPAGTPTGTAREPAGTPTGMAREPAGTPTGTATDAPTAEPTPTATEAPTEPPESAAHHDPADGFADFASWLDDDAPVRRVTEPTREALADAVHGSGPRVVVFETSGTVHLGGRELRVTGDRLFLAGQTAPSPGITVVGGRFTLDASESVVQHVRFRKGSDGPVGEGAGDAFQSGDGTRNNVVDHCTATWGADETLSVGYRSRNTTVTNCVVAEALRFPYEDPETDVHNGTLVGDGAENAVFAGNLWAHNTARNPRLKVDTSTVLANNLVYHFEQAVNMGYTATATVEGNGFLRANTDGRNVTGERRDGDASEAYVADNYSEPGTAMTNEPQIELLDSRPLWPADMTAMPAERVEARTLRHAGARPADRTHHDRRVVEQVRARTGDYVDSEAAVGGYPDLAENARELDVPDTGLRTWLRRHARRVEPGGRRAK